MFQEASWQWGTSVSLKTLFVATTKYWQWLLAEWVWVICGMTLTGKNWRNRRRTYLSVTLSTINLTWAPLSSKQCLQAERPLTDRLSHGRAGAGIRTHLTSVHLTYTPYTVHLPKQKRFWRPSHNNKVIQVSHNKVLQVQSVLCWLLFCRASRNSASFLSRILTWHSWRPMTTTGTAKIFLVLFLSMIFVWEVRKYNEAHAFCMLDT